MDAQVTNTAAKDFNGKLVYLGHAQTSGYVGKHHCAVKQPLSYHIYNPAE
jgi:hypothetical protein